MFYNSDFNWRILAIPQLDCEGFFNPMSPAVDSEIASNTFSHEIEGVSGT
jgi:hypothetical protein